jgi:hypothetical protein
MKLNLSTAQWLTILAFSMINLPPATAIAQGTAFTYQGRLQNNGTLAGGSYNLKFTLFDTDVGGVAIAGPVTNTAVSVTNGLFLALIDFGPGAVPGRTNWLEIGVASNGVGTFTALAPRQQLTPTPYAIYAENANAAGLSGTLTAAQLPASVVTNGAVGLNLVGNFSGDGGGLTNVNAATATTAGTAGIANNFGNSASWGRWLWPNTIKAIANHQSWRWMSFGDSLASIIGGQTNGWPCDLLQLYQHAFGDGGYFGMGSPINRVGVQPFDAHLMGTGGGTGTAYATNDRTVWFGASVHAYGPGSFTAQWTPQCAPGGGILANVVKLYYIEQTNAGTFDVYTGHNGVFTRALSGIDANIAGPPHGKVLTVVDSTNLSYYQVMASNTLPANTVINFVGAALLNTLNGGVAYGDFSGGGGQLDWFTQISTNVTGPILADYNPQLLTSIWYDNAATWSNNESAFYQFVTNFLPHTDVVILGAPPVTNDTPAGIIGQNAVCRNNAPLFGWPYFDGWNIFGNWTNMYNEGFVCGVTDVHPTDSGWAYYATALDEWLGLEHTAGRDATACFTNQIQGYLMNGYSLNGTVYSNLVAGGSPAAPQYGPMGFGWDAGNPAMPGIAYYNGGTGELQAMVLRGGPGSGTNGGFSFRNSSGSPIGTLDPSGNLAISGRYNGNGSGLTNVHTATADSSLLVGVWLYTNNVGTWFGTNADAVIQAYASAPGNIGDTIYIGPGLFNSIPGITKPVNIYGSGVGEWSVAKDRFEGGTILTNWTGYMYFGPGYSNSVFANLAVEGEDYVCNWWPCVTNLFNQKIRNVAFGHCARNAGVHLIEITGANFDIDGLSVYGSKDDNCSYGIIFKGCSNVVARNLYQYRAATCNNHAFLVKADGIGASGSKGGIWNVTVDGYVGDLGNNNANPIVIAAYSTNAILSGVTLRNFTFTGGSTIKAATINLISVAPNCVFENVDISEVHSRSPAYYLVTMNGYPGAGPYSNVYIHNCSLFNPNALGPASVDSWATNGVFRFDNCMVNGTNYSGTNTYYFNTVTGWPKNVSAALNNISGGLSADWISGNGSGLRNVGAAQFAFGTTTNFYPHVTNGIVTFTTSP